MKGTTVAVTTALAVGLLAGGAGASTSPLVTATSALAADVRSLSDDSSADVFGVGGGKVEGGLQKFNLSAHEGPSGDFGHVGVTYTDGLGQTIVSYSVDVICVHIHSLAPVGPYDRGVIKGVIKNISPVPNLLMLDVGDVVDFGIKDGGNPSSITPVDDFYAPSSPGIPPEASCKLFTYDGDLNNVTQGNVNIKGP